MVLAKYTWKITYYLYNTVAMCFMGGGMSD